MIGFPSFPSPIVTDAREKWIGLGSGASFIFVHSMTTPLPFFFDAVLGIKRAGESHVPPVRASFPPDPYGEPKGWCTP